MLVKGEELGCAPIKTQNKEGTLELKEIHFKINEVLYYYNKKDMSGERAMMAYEKLCGLGEELKDLKVGNKAQPKKEEILEALRGVCKGLKNYADNFDWNRAGISPEDIQRSIRYEVSQLVKAKKEGKFNDMKNVFKYLEDIRELKKTMILPLYDNVCCIWSVGQKKNFMASLMDFNKELLEIVNNYYSIRFKLEY